MPQLNCHLVSSTVDETNCHLLKQHLPSLATLHQTDTEYTHPRWTNSAIPLLPFYLPLRARSHLQQALPPPLLPLPPPLLPLPPPLLPLHPVIFPAFPPSSLLYPHYLISTVTGQNANSIDTNKRKNGNRVFPPC